MIHAGVHLCVRQLRHFKTQQYATASDVSCSDHTLLKAHIVGLTYVRMDLAVEVVAIERGRASCGRNMLRAPCETRVSAEEKVNSCAYRARIQEYNLAAFSSLLSAVLFLVAAVQCGCFLQFFRSCALCVLFVVMVESPAASLCTNTSRCWTIWAVRSCLVCVLCGMEGARMYPFPNLEIVPLVRSVFSKKINGSGSRAKLLRTGEEARLSRIASWPRPCLGKGLLQG